MEGQAVMINEAERQISQLTVRALRHADEGFREFDRRIESCSIAFEDGDDGHAREELVGLVRPLGDFAGFCNAVMKNCGHLLPSVTVEAMGRANRKLQEALTCIVMETEDGNDSGVGDALRLDLADALNSYEELFPMIAEELEQV